MDILFYFYISIFNFNFLYSHLYVLALDNRAKGVAIATCCHHACVWGDYTGSDWLEKQGECESEGERERECVSVYLRELVKRNRERERRCV